MTHIIEDIRRNKEKEIQQVGEYLFEMIDGTILDLAFSDGSTKGLNYDDRVTILEVADLSLPKEKNVKISEHERNSVVLMFALRNFCKRFGEKNRDEETMEFFDEILILTAYLEVMFTYGSNAERNIAVRPFASDKYFDFINQYNSDTPIQSAYIDSKIYEISEDGSRAVVRLTYSYGIVDITPNKYEMLVSLSISKNSKGAYQIDSQENEVIQYQTQTKEG